MGMIMKRKTMTDNTKHLIQFGNSEYKNKECSVCGRVFRPTHGRQKMCFTCREYFDAGRYARTSTASNVDSSDATIRRRFEEKERNCTIVGEGYAERQIAESLRIAGKVKTEL